MSRITRQTPTQTHFNIVNAERVRNGQVPFTPIEYSTMFTELPELVPVVSTSDHSGARNAPLQASTSNTSTTDIKRWFASNTPSWNMLDGFRNLLRMKLDDLKFQQYPNISLEAQVEMGELIQLQHVVTTLLLAREHGTFSF